MKRLFVLMLVIVCGCALLPVVAKDIDMEIRGHDPDPNSILTFDVNGLPLQVGDTNYVDFENVPQDWLDIIYQDVNDVNNIESWTFAKARLYGVLNYGIYEGDVIVTDEDGAKGIKSLKIIVNAAPRIDMIK